MNSSQSYFLIEITRLKPVGTESVKPALKYVFPLEILLKISPLFSSETNHGLTNSETLETSVESLPTSKALYSIFTEKSSPISNLSSKSPPLSPSQSVLCSQFVDRKSTRLNSSHSSISYAVFCLKKTLHSSANEKQCTQRFTTAHEKGTFLSL